MKKILFPVLLLFLTTISCSTEEVNVEPVTENPETPTNPENPTNTNFSEENPLPAFLSSTRYNEHIELCSNTSVFDEVGFKFKSLAKGTINKINVKIPITNNNLIVTIKDFATNQIIRSETVNVTSANVDIVKTIAPLDLEKDKVYLITMKTNNYYKRFRNDFTQAMYPITVGNIKVMAPMTSMLSPDGSLGGSGNFYSGDVSFTFLRTE